MKLPFAWLLCAAFAFAPAAQAAPARRQPEKSRIRHALQRGAAAAERKDWENARLAWRAVLDLDSENSDAREGLREAQYQVLFQQGVERSSAGRLDEARQAYSACLLFRPDDPPAVRRLAELDARLARADQARKSLASAAALLRSGDWNRLDRELASAAASGLGAPGVLAPLLECARGNLDAALLSLKAPPTAADAALWRMASGYVASRRRMWYARQYGPLLGAIYVCCLLALTFFGLKRAATTEDA